MGHFYGELFRDAWSDEELLEPGEIGHRVNVGAVDLLQVILTKEQVTFQGRTVEIDRARYGEEIPAEVGIWDREFRPELLGHRHGWARRECHTKDPRIGAGDTLIVAEFPYTGRRRYACATFRPGLHKPRKPHFGAKFENDIRAAKEQKRVDLVTYALQRLEDPSVVTKDPFNTGRTKRVAGISIPPAMFGEEVGDYLPSIPGEGRSALWSFGVVANATKVLGAVRLEADELLLRVIKAQGGDDHLRYIEPPIGSKRAAPLMLSPAVYSKTDELLPHAAYLALVGPAPNKPMPEDRSVGKIALYRLLRLLDNMQRQVDRVRKRKGYQHGI